MEKLYIVLIIFLLNINTLYAFTWETCIKKYQKAKEFTGHTKLMYIYLKSTKKCLIKFKNTLIKNPNPKFNISAMDDNIKMINRYINTIVPDYSYPKNNLEQIPKYILQNSTTPIFNKEYENFKKFKNCNGVHAKDKIYTAKHCDIKDAKNIRYDLSYIKTKTLSKLKTAKLKLDKLGTFKYYSMSNEGMFYNALLKETNCSFYKAKNKPNGLNTTLDLTDLKKKEEIRSNCLAIPSNSGGGVFQNGNLVGIISKTVFDDNKFLYSVIEPIYPLK